MIEKYVMVCPVIGSLHYELWHPNWKFGNVHFCIILN